jgi:hypothetical protein
MRRTNALVWPDRMHAIWLKLDEQAVAAAGFASMAEARWRLGELFARHGFERRGDLLVPGSGSGTSVAAVLAMQAVIRDARWLGGCLVEARLMRIEEIAHLSPLLGRD